MWQYIRRRIRLALGHYDDFTVDELVRYCNKGMVDHKDIARHYGCDSWWKCEVIDIRDLRKHKAA